MKVMLMFSLLFLGLILIGHSCHGLDLQSPSFLEDSLHLDKAVAKNLFQSKLISLLNSLSARRYCRFVAQLAAELGIKFSRTQDLLAKIEGDSSSFRIMPKQRQNRRACRHWQAKVVHFRKLFRIKDTKKPPNGKAERIDIIERELPSLFNNLPLPFQCELLFEVGRRSVFKPFEASDNSVNSITKMNLYEVGNIVQKSERTLTQDISIVRVADRCVKVLAGKKYRTTDVTISAELDDHQLRKWKRGFRTKMQWIMGRFAENNGIKLENLHNLTAKQNLPYSAYFTHLLNTSETGRRIEMRFHMHVIKANSRALEARFVLAALDALDKETLMKILEAKDIKYVAVDHFIGTGIGAMHSYNLKMLFPTYLRRYFNTALRRHEQCLIIHLVTKYSNSSSEKVIEFLKRKKIDVKFPCSTMNGVMSVVLSPKRNRENEVVVPNTAQPSGETTLLTLQLHPFWNIGRKTDGLPATRSINQVKKKYVHYRKATMVEIVMFVLLGSLSVVLVVFFVTCVLFVVRKRRLRKHMDLMLQQQQRLKMDAPSQSNPESVPLNSELRVDHLNPSNFASGAPLRDYQEKCECLLLPREGISVHDQQSRSERLTSVNLEPLRFSTDDEESRYEDEGNFRFSPTSKHFDPSSLYRGGKRLVPAIRYSKALARRRAQMDGGKEALEKVPEMRTVEVAQRCGSARQVLSLNGGQCSLALDCEGACALSRNKIAVFELASDPRAVERCEASDDRPCSTSGESARVEIVMKNEARAWNCLQENADGDALTKVSGRKRRKKRKKSHSRGAERRSSKKSIEQRYERQHKKRIHKSRNNDDELRHRGEGKEAEEKSHVIDSTKAEKFDVNEQMGALVDNRQVASPSNILSNHEDDTGLEENNTNIV